MRTVAFQTLGCKVNQYDSQAMLERFEQAGYKILAAHERADVLVINTCVVTGEGERKSRQAIRRARAMHPDADIVVAGCLAQKEAGGLLAEGARLVIGTQRRARVVELLEQAQREGTRLSAVGSLTGIPFENLRVSGHEGHTRAVMKIQEGCDRYCAYCIIPSVRGAVRSRPLADIREEAGALARAGYREAVLTGIHLSSFGRGTGHDLADAAQAVAAAGMGRVRLGSLEPVIVTEAFARRLAGIPGLCPQFHLSLQSGSDAVLQRMRRRYTAAAYREAADTLRRHFPGCALTTDVIAGFPGETEREFEETFAFVQSVGFARLHVFPFSAREGTAAASMPGQLPRQVKNARAAALIAAGDAAAAAYRAAMLGSVRDVLFEERAGDAWAGYTPEYLRVRAHGAAAGQVRPVRLTALDGECFAGDIIG
ncbi:MAG: tRNA (N(6)-L-threonylcarbamoyladenosine(37)-C(2))-methylthiotransferase MtaB [Christensenellales bacterium]|jgi:threonylcarbamoyladenosine tRNA methylthiotransferase MtaB